MLPTRHLGQEQQLRRPTSERSLSSQLLPGALTARQMPNPSSGVVCALIRAPRDSQKDCRIASEAPTTATTPVYQATNDVYDELVFEVLPKIWTVFGANDVKEVKGIGG
jgi:hypothetical protein